MRYVVTVLSSCAVAALAYFATALAMVPAPIEAEYWVREMIVVKRSIARAYAGRRKLIVASGSAALFGVDAARLGRELGRPVLNSGLHGAMSLERILEEAAGAATAGDAVILALEPKLYCAQGPSAWQARNAVAWDRDQWRAWSARERVQAIGALGPSRVLEMAAARRDLAFSPESLRRRLETLDDAKVLAKWRARAAPKRFAYSAYHLDEFGDMLGTDGAKFDGTPRPADAETAVCPGSLRLLRRFASRMREKDVALRFANAPYVGDDRMPKEAIESASRNFTQAISAIAPVLDSRNDVLFARELFFDTELHLNARGREIRTLRLARAIRADAALGSHFNGRLRGRTSRPPLAEPHDPLELSAAPEPVTSRRHGATMGEGVKILEAGARLILTGTDAEEVKSALHAFLTRGARLLSPPTQLGGKWVTACTVPVEPESSEKAAAEDDDPCKVEELGLKRIVTGPTRGLVRLKAEELVHRGATLIGDVENVDGTWIALCDTGGRRPPMR